MFKGVGRVQGATGGRGGWGALPPQPEGVKGGRATGAPVEGSSRRRRQAAAGHTAQTPGRTQVEKCGRWAFLLLAKTGTLSARDTVLIFFLCNWYFGIGMLCFPRAQVVKSASL